MTARLCRRIEIKQGIPKASPQPGTTNPHSSATTAGLPEPYPSLRPWHSWKAGALLHPLQ